MSAIERDERGYAFEFSEFYNCVERKTPGQFTSVVIEPDTSGVEVTIDSGSGYMASHASGFIHADVMVKIMERMGYVVTRKE